MKHGATCPRFCSQCAGAVPKRVAIAGAELVIDGAPADRPIDVEAESAQRFYARRGGRARAKGRSTP